MNTKFKKLAISAGIATALGGVSMPSHAIIEGVAGEALLVPFVLYDTRTSINTIVELTIPGSVGLDTIPNNYTASHSTPTGDDISTNADAFGATPAPKIHWYFFDSKSNELTNGDIPVTADDFYLFNWGDLVVKQKSGLNGVKGYLIFGTEKATTAGPVKGSHAAADFSFFGDAFMVFPLGVGFIDAKIPVLPMNDGIDPFLQAGEAPKVTIDNQVVYGSNGHVIAASPLISGMRTNFSDGIPNITAFDLTLSNRLLPSLHVIWNDNNQNVSAGVEVFDDNENPCSTEVPLPNELNVIWVGPRHHHDHDGPSISEAEAELRKKDLVPKWVDLATELCFPNQGQSNTQPGFARYDIPEPIDTDIGTPESAAVAFSIQLQIDLLDDNGALLDEPQLLPIESALGHERGKFY